MIYSLSASYCPCVFCSFNVEYTVLLYKSWKRKKNNIMHYNVNLTNKGNKTFLSFFLYQTFSKKHITTRNLTQFKGLIIVFLSLYQRMKKTKKHFHTDQVVSNKMFILFLFYVLRLPCSYSSHSLRHPSFGLSSSSLNLR